MTIIKGYPSQGKEDASKQEVVTVQPLKNGQHGMDVVANGTAIVVASDAVEALSTAQVIVATGHLAEPGDVIRFTTGGTLFPREISVESVTANTITLVRPAPSIPTTTDPFDILRFQHQTISTSGASSTQISFDRNSTNTIVTEDTGTPANSRPLPVKIFDNAGSPASFAAGAVDATTIRNTPASDSPHLLATRHEAVTTPLAGRLTDGTDFISSEALAAAQKTVATSTKGIATVGVTLGWDGVTHRELAVSTVGGTTLDAKHEAVATPLAGRLSDGTNFIGSEALAAAQKTLTSETAILSTLAVGLGWDGATHREIAVDNAGSTKTTTQTVAASFPARGKITGTALTGTYANIFTAASDIQTLFLINNCDQVILISLDAGVTDHVELASNQSISYDFGSNSRHLASGTDIRVKHGGVVPTTGAITVSAVV